MIDKKTRSLILDLILYLLIIVSVFFIPAFKINSSFLSLWNLSNISNISFILILSMTALAIIGIIITTLCYGVDNSSLSSINIIVPIVSFLSMCIFFVVILQDVSDYPYITQLPWALISITLLYIFLVISKISNLASPPEDENKYRRVKEFKQSRVWIIVRLIFLGAFFCYSIYLVSTDFSIGLCLFSIGGFCFLLLIAFRGGMEADIFIDEKDVTLVWLSYYIFKWPNIQKIPLNEIKRLEIRSAPKITFLMIATKKSHPGAYVVSVDGVGGDYMRYLQESVLKDCSIYTYGWFLEEKRIR